jgi:hypothetical protein
LFYVSACPKYRPRPTQPTIEQAWSDSDSDKDSLQQQLETVNILSGSVFSMLVLGFVSFVVKQCRLRAKKNNTYKQRCLQLEQQLALPSRNMVRTVSASPAVAAPPGAAPPVAAPAMAPRPIIPV